MKQENNTAKLGYLEDLWDENISQNFDEPELLRYRSNLLGSDLRITNFGGDNTSAKIKLRDPFDGRDHTVLWVKGSGGDLRTMNRSAFAALYLERLRALENCYRGAEYEDEMVDYYPLAAFGTRGAAPSIDTPLHGFLPFPHVDHLHPDWGIALAAAANGKARTEEFNRRFGHHLVWLPWQRPGFELAMVLRRAVAPDPQCDGVVLGGHGLFSWGESSRKCYLNSITLIDHLGQFVNEHTASVGAKLFDGSIHRARHDRRDLAVDLFPFLRGRVSQNRRAIGNFSDLPEVLRFVNSVNAAKLAHLGTSCPDHFVRTKVRPLFVPWDPRNDDGLQLRRAVDSSLQVYRKEYEEYYRAYARPDSPAMRDPNPAVVLVPGVGMFSFGRNKSDARITGEFYVNAIHVMEGATSLDDSTIVKALPQAGFAARSEEFRTHHNYVALPLREAFNIEYWQLEQAKLRRMPAEKEFNRNVVFIVGGASGIGRQTALLAAQRGAQVVVGDIHSEMAAATAAEVNECVDKEMAVSCPLDIRDRNSVRKAVRVAVEAFGGVDHSDQYCCDGARLRRQSC
jgi:rhamnose utilization protein RhaD (predicted bifunctional aldolase and dehydrogenase)